MVNTDEQFMKLALEQAQTALDNGNFPFGAVVVQDGEVVGSGRCKEVTEHDVTRHAELMAVSEACQKLGSVALDNCTVYASGEPCNMCASAIFQADIGRVVIGATRDDLPYFFRDRNIRIFDLAKDLRYQPEIVTGVLKAEAIKLFNGIKK